MSVRLTRKPICGHLVRNMFASVRTAELSSAFFGRRFKTTEISGIVFVYDGSKPKKGIIMEITKVNKEEIIRVGREALSKARNDDCGVLGNTTLTPAMIIAAGLDKGYRIKVTFFEFSDFSGLLTKAAGAESCIAVISVPRNPPVNILNGLRGITDNAIHTVTNIDKTLINETVIYLIGISPARRAEYAIEYAINLL